MNRVTLSIICLITTAMLFFACGGATESEADKEEDATSAAASSSAAALKESIQRGKAVYTGAGICVTCHMQDGKGQAGVFPPLANSDYLMGDRKRAILQVLNGATGEMVVNGVTYNGVMPPMGLSLSDEQIADVLNYVMNNWGNTNKIMIKPEEVAAERE